ncbi:universal stress protein [Sulfitobacter sp. R86518]|uniref:universal stress protein n=1 Tax=Sulfitobacter sp. R86518 TaxID=3093858 RepID=UPI0036DAB6D0
MYKNILIPVVFETPEITQTAFDAAQALAAPDARLTLLHVIEAVPVYVAEYIPTDIVTSTREAVQARLDALALRVPGAATAIADGRAGPRATRWAEENGTDCIVIASHQPALSDILLGSVAQYVVRHAKCAVHVVR